MTNAKVLNKGVETTVDLSSFCKINDGANTLLVNRKGLEIKEVLMIEKGTGKSKTIVPIKTDFLGEYDNADLDPKIYKDALLEPPGWNGGRDEGVRERRLNNMIKSQVSEMEHSRRLDLTGCQSVKVIYITIGADLPFRDYYGSVENAAARIASIFEMANMYYEKFCKRLKVDVIDFRDYSSVVNRPNLCGSGSTNEVLYQFRVNSALSGTAGSNTGQSHLFFGKSTNGYGCRSSCYIGCAYLDNTCRSAGYGVNYMMYELEFGASAPTLYKQSLLFAHEAGHTSGSEHDASNSGFVMQPSIGAGITAFSSSSISQINSHIDRITNSQCVQTASRGNGVCTEGAEDWDSVDCGLCTPSGVCNTPAGSCGSVQGTDNCGGSCTIVNTCGSGEFCNSGTCVSCTTICSTPAGSCGSNIQGTDGCGNACSRTVGCSSGQLCNNGTCQVDPCARLSKKKCKGSCTFQGGLCRSIVR
jgi:hypothetical protein